MSLPDSLPPVLRAALPPVKRALAVWTGDASPESAYVCDKRALALVEACEDPGLLGTLRAKRADGSLVHPTILEQVFSDAVAGGWDAVRPVLVFGASRWSRRDWAWVRFVDAADQPACDVEVGAFALLLALLGRVDRFSTYGGMAGGPLALWKDGLVVGALMGARLVLSAEPVLAGEVPVPRPAAPPWFAPAGSHPSPFPERPKTYQREPSTDPAVLVAALASLDRSLAATATALGGVALPAGAQGPRWALDSRSGLLIVSMERYPGWASNPHRSDHGPFQLSLHFAEPRRTYGGLHDFSWLLGMDELGRVALHQEPSETTETFAGRIESDLASLTQGPGDRRPPEALRALADDLDAFVRATQPLRPGRGPVLGPGPVPVFAAVPARTHPPRDLWQVLDRQTWRTLEGMAPRRVIERHVRRLNASARTPFAPEDL